MSAEMRASVLLTLKDELTGKAKQAEGALKGLGGAAKGLAGSGAGMSKVAADAEKMAAATTRAASASRAVTDPWAAVGRSASAAAASINQVAAATERAASAQRRMNARDWASTYAGWRGENKHADREARREVVKGEGSSTILGGGGDGKLGKAINAYIGYQIAKGIVHGADHMVARAGDVDAMREKLTWSMGGDKAMAGAAVDKAKALSAKYGNTTTLENLHIIDDLRANLPEDMAHILDQTAEPFVKMHGFLKAWEGGAHKGKAEHALKEIGAAIRAGELTGAMTGDLLVGHAKALTAAKIVFGEKFKASEYFQATQKAATALSAANATFRYVDFPVLVQRLGQGGGVALATAFTKIVAGGRVTQGAAEAWRELGLVDMDQVRTGKSGRIEPSSLVGKRWLKGGDEWGINPTDALMTRLVPALAEKGGLAGLKGLDQAWKDGNVEKLAHTLEAFRKDEAAMTQLSRKLQALGYDRNAVKLLEEVILGSPSLMRDRQRTAAVDSDVENYSSYDKAKQTLDAAGDRLLQAVTGKDFVGNIIAGINALAGIADRMTAGIDKLKAAYDKDGALGAAKEAGKGVAGWLAGKDDKGETDWGLSGLAWDWFKSSVIGGNASAAPGAGGYDPSLGALRGTLMPSPAWRGMATAGAAAVAGLGAAGYDPASAAAARLQGAESVASSDMPATAGAEAQPAIMGAATAPITIQAQGPTVTFNQAPPSISISVTVNATTNASPEAIGAAAASQVESAARGGLFDHQ